MSLDSLSPEKYLVFNSLSPLKEKIYNPDYSARVNNFIKENLELLNPDQIEIQKKNIKNLMVSSKGCKNDSYRNTIVAVFKLLQQIPPFVITVANGEPIKIGYNKKALFKALFASHGHNRMVDMKNFTKDEINQYLSFILTENSSELKKEEAYKLHQIAQAFNNCDSNIHNLISNALIYDIFTEINSPDANIKELVEFILNCGAEAFEKINVDDNTIFLEILISMINRGFPEQAVKIAGQMKSAPFREYLLGTLMNHLIKNKYKTIAQELLPQLSEYDMMYFKIRLNPPDLHQNFALIEVPVEADLPIRAPLPQRQECTDAFITSLLEKLTQDSLGEVTKAEKIKKTPSLEETALAQELEEKSGKWWTCIGIEPGLHGGKVFKFEMKKEMMKEEFKKETLALNEKIKEISPALELTFEKALLLCNDRDARYMGITVAKEIGYKAEFIQDGRDEKLILYLLDKNALIANWNEYCTKNLELKLPHLDIVDGEGIAGDLEFVEALLHHDALLSRGQEFVHDSTAHIFPVLERIVEAAKTKNPYGHFGFHRKEIKLYYDKIVLAKELISLQPDTIKQIDKSLVEKIHTHMDKIEAALGALTDSLSSEAAINLVNNPIPNRNLFMAFNNTFYTPYWEKRFGAATSSQKILQEVWEGIELLCKAGNPKV